MPLLLVTKSSSYHPAHIIFLQTFSKKLHGKTVHSRRFNHQSISDVDATGRAPDAPSQTFLAEPDGFQLCGPRTLKTLVQSNLDVLDVLKATRVTRVYVLIFKL